MLRAHLKLDFSRSFSMNQLCEQPEVGKLLPCVIEFEEQYVGRADACSHSQAPPARDIRMSNTIEPLTRATSSHHQLNLRQSVPHLSLMDLRSLPARLASRLRTSGVRS